MLKKGFTEHLLAVSFSIAFIHLSFYYRVHYEEDKNISIHFHLFFYSPYVYMDNT
jgi:hypothetical protein